MSSSTRKKRKASPGSGKAPRRAPTPKSKSTSSAPLDKQTPEAPVTKLFHPLAAELASSIERDTDLMARVAAGQLSQGDPLIGEAKRLAKQATKLWRDLLARTRAGDSSPYVGSVSQPLRVLNDEDAMSFGVVGKRPVRRPRRRESLAPDELRYLPTLKDTIYATAWKRLGALTRFPWKRVNDGTIEALRPDSAQVLAVSLWSLAADSDAQVLRDLLKFHTNGVFSPRFLPYKPLDNWIRYEIPASEVRNSAPAAPRLGVVVGSPEAVCVVETETLDRSHQRCPAFLSGRCDGSVANSGRGCPLDVAEGEDAFPYRRIKNLLKMGTLEDGKPCPFANDNFHNMRVVFAGANLEPREGSFAVVFCYVGSWNPASAASLEALQDILWDIYGSRVVAVDLDDVVDALLGSADHAAADLGIYLWRRIRALGATQLARLIAAELPEPSDGVAPRKRIGSLKLPRVAPLLPLVPDSPREWRSSRDGWGSQYVADVFPFVHPKSGAEAFVTRTRSTVRLRVPMSSNGEELVRAALAALAADSEEPGEQTAVGDYATGSISRPCDIEPALAVLRSAGFLEDQR